MTKLIQSQISPHVSIDGGSGGICLIQLTILSQKVHLFEAYFYKILLPKILKFQTLNFLYFLLNEWLFLSWGSKMKSVASWTALEHRETKHCTTMFPIVYSCVRPAALCRLWVCVSCSFSSAGRRRCAELPPSSWLSQSQSVTPTRQVFPQPAARIHLAHKHNTDRRTLLSKRQCQSRSNFGGIILIFGCTWCRWFFFFIPCIFARRDSAPDRRTAALTFV